MNPTNTPDDLADYWAAIEESLWIDKKAVTTSRNVFIEGSI